MCRDLLEAIVASPQAEDRWLGLADWLEKHDDPRRAELLRLHRRLLATCCEPDRHPDRAAWQTRIVELLIQGVRPCGPERAAGLPRGAEMTFRFIPPGRFLIGSPEDEMGHNRWERQRPVTVKRGFWLGAHPVTQLQWQAVMGDIPYRRPWTRPWSNDWEQATGIRITGDPSDHLPATKVSFTDCQEFCERATSLTGTRFRLPREAEWEYACRAGTTTPFFFGETISTALANYNGNYSYGRGKRGPFPAQPTPVDIYPPNAWGLHDLLGNVLEWCNSRFARKVHGRDRDPSRGGRRNGLVQRGGAFNWEPVDCRSASRYYGFDFNSDYILGCRVILELD